MWVVAMPSLAQPLSDFLTAAERANLDARTGAQARERAEAEFAQAWGGLLPSLTASGGWTHNQYDAVQDFPTGATTTKTVTIVPKDQLDAQLKVEVPLLDLSRWLKTAAASSSAQAADRREGSTREQVRRQVVTGFYAYLGARAVLESAQRSLALSQAQVDVTAASRTSVAAGLALVPTVNAQFTQRFTNATGFQGQAALYNAGLTFNWRLDVPAVAGMRALRAGQETALIAAERARRAAADQLHGDWHKTRAALKKVAAARAQVTAARRASSLAHERNLAGVATQLDVIQSERDLFTAEVSDIQARAELASARALLALSSGEPLEGRP